MFRQRTRAREESATGDLRRLSSVNPVISAFLSPSLQHLGRYVSPSKRPQSFQRRAGNPVGCSKGVFGVTLEGSHSGRMSYTKL